MQRRLIVMRHAKSSWSSPAPTDHERPLNKRGRRDSPKVGVALAERNWVPDLVLSSDSQRTQETFAGMNESFPNPVEARFLSSFYHGGLFEFREVISTVDDEIGCLLVLGHNPGWEDLTGWLSGEDIIMKTATAALLTRDLPSWGAACEAGCWKLEEVIYPRQL